MEYSQKVLRAIAAAAEMAGVTEAEATEYLSDIDWGVIDPAEPIDYQELAEIIEAKELEEAYNEQNFHSVVIHEVG